MPSYGLLIFNRNDVVGTTKQFPNSTTNKRNDEYIKLYDHNEWKPGDNDKH